MGTKPELSTLQAIRAPRWLTGTFAQPQSHGDSAQERGHICLSRWRCELFLYVIPVLSTAREGETVGATALPHAWSSLYQPLLGSLKVEGPSEPRDDLGLAAWARLPPAGCMHIITP